MKKLSGFSLMEMLVVLLIVSIIAAASAPMINKQILTTAAGKSPWIWTTGNNIAYNIKGDDRTASIGVADPPTSNHKARLYLATKLIEQKYMPQIAFGDSSNGTPMKFISAKNNVWISTKDAGSGITHGSVAIGNETSVYGTSSIAIGNNTTVSNSTAIAIGNNTCANMVGTVAIGSDINIKEAAECSIAIGNKPSVSGGVYSIAIGEKATVSGSASNATYKSNRSIAIGNGAKIHYGTGSIAIGNSAETYYATKSVAIGNSAETSFANRSIAIGNKATTHFADDSIAFGNNTTAKGSGSIAIGNNTTANDHGSIAIGNNTTANDCDSIAIGGGDNGNYTSTSSPSCIAIGYQTKAGTGGAVVGSTAIGYQVTASGAPSVAIGYNATADHFKSMAIGFNAKTTDNHQIVLGNNSTTVYIPGNLVVGGRTILGLSSNSHTILWGKLRGRDYYDYRVVRLGAKDDGNLEQSDHDQFGTTLENFYNKYSKFYSDRRLKNVGKAFVGGLEEIKKLEVFNYTFKADKSKTPRVGVMAQDLQKIFPDAVIKGEDGFLRIRMEDMFYALVNAVKELAYKFEIHDKKIEELTKQNIELQKTIDNLEKRIEKLETDIAQ